MRQHQLNSLIDDMRQAITGRLMVPCDDGYDTGRAVFNSSVDVRPAMIAQCLDVADVQAAVRIARKAGLPISVKAGSHDSEGRALNEGGLVIDLSRFTSIGINRNGNTATIGGGVRAGQLVARASSLGHGCGYRNGE